MKFSYWNYYRKAIFPLISLTLPFALVEQFIFEEASKSSNKIAYGISGIALGMLETFLVLILLGYTVYKIQSSKVELGKYYKKHFRDLVIESFRAMGRIALGLLLIFPGVKRAIEYYLIPYIVQFDDSYNAGKVDVLEKAESLLKNHLAKFVTILCLTQIVTFAIQIASVNFNLFTSPLVWILFYVGEISIQTVVFLYFYNYYCALNISLSKNIRCEAAEH